MGWDRIPSITSSTVRLHCWLTSWLTGRVGEYGTDKVTVTHKMYKGTRYKKDMKDRSVLHNRNVKNIETNVIVDKITSFPLCLRCVAQRA